MQKQTIRHSNFIPNLDIPMRNNIHTISARSLQPRIGITIVIRKSSWAQKKTRRLLPTRHHNTEIALHRLDPLHLLIRQHNLNARQIFNRLPLLNKLPRRNRSFVRDHRIPIRARNLERTVGLVDADVPPQMFPEVIPLLFRLQRVGKLAQGWEREELLFGGAGVVVDDYVILQDVGYVFFFDAAGDSVCALVLADGGPVVCLVCSAIARTG